MSCSGTTQSAALQQVQPFQAVEPGPCPPEGCPPPTEIVAVRVAQVFDSCAQSDQIAVSTTPLTVTTASLLGVTYACTVVAGTASIGATPPNANGLVNVLVTVPFTVMFTASTTTITFAPVTGTATALATVYAPTGTTLQIDFTLDCSPPVPTVTPVSATESLLTLTNVVFCCFVITSEATVQLLMPSYGLNPIGPCQPVGGMACPPAPPPIQGG